MFATRDSRCGGVLGEGPADHQQSKVWLPLILTEEQQATNTWLLAMARLKDGITVQQANQSMAILAARLERELWRGRGWTVSVEPFRNNFVRDSTKRGIWLLLAAERGPVEWEPRQRPPQGNLLRRG